VVHPDFQGKGLKASFMKYMLKKLRLKTLATLLYLLIHMLDFIGVWVLDLTPIKGMFWYPN